MWNDGFVIEEGLLPYAYIIKFRTSRLQVNTSHLKLDKSIFS